MALILDPERWSREDLLGLASAPQQGLVRLLDIFSYGVVPFPTPFSGEAAIGLLETAIALRDTGTRVDGDRHLASIVNVQYHTMLAVKGLVPSTLTRDRAAKKSTIDADPVRSGPLRAWAADIRRDGPALCGPRWPVNTRLNRRSPDRHSLSPRAKRPGSSGGPVGWPLLGRLTKRGRGGRDSSGGPLPIRVERGVDPDPEVGNGEVPPQDEHTCDVGPLSVRFMHEGGLQNVPRHRRIEPGSVHAVPAVAHLQSREGDVVADPHGEALARDRRAGRAP